VQNRVRPTQNETGAALVELAVSLPLLILILVGTIDFARIFYTAIELSNAARAGAEYATYDVGRATGSMTNAQNAAIAAAPNINTVSASASSLCQCATNSGVVTATTPPNTCTATCSGTGGHIVISVTVTATRTFTTIARFPGVPNTITLSRSATLRAVP